MSGIGTHHRTTPSVAATRKPELPHRSEYGMALSERLDQAPRRSTGIPCSVGALEDRLEGKEADALYAMLHTLGWSATRVYDTLVAEGYEVGRQTINRHRSRSCRCFQ